MPKKTVIHLPIFSTKGTMPVRVRESLCEADSVFQRIQVEDLETFGRSLIIDGVMQCAESDHALYDKALLKLATASDKRLLILGGGDGYIAEMALKKNPRLHVTIVDLDLDVVDVCKKYLGQKVFGKENVHLHIGDALHFLRSSKGGPKYDGIIFDLTDTPIGRRNKAVFTKFYRALVRLSGTLLSKNGWISSQAGASQVSTGYIDAATILEDILKRHFASVTRDDILIPSYGEPCAFLFGKNSPID